MLEPDTIVTLFLVWRSQLSRLRRIWASRRAGRTVHDRRRGFPPPRAQSLQRTAWRRRDCRGCSHCMFRCRTACAWPSMSGSRRAPRPIPGCPTVLEADRYWRARAYTGGIKKNPNYYIAAAVERSRVRLCVRRPAWHRRLVRHAPGRAGPPIGRRCRLAGRTGSPPSHGRTGASG